MKEQLLELLEKINLCRNQAEIDKIILDWKIKNEDINNWIDTLWDSLDEFDMEKMPYILDALYKQNDKIKFMMFCMLLEATHDKLPFITNIETYQIFKEKYLMLIPTLAKIASMSYNGIADALYLVLLKADPKGELLDEENKQIIIDGINKKLPVLKKYLDSDEEVPSIVYEALEVILDVSCYINKEETLKLIKEFSKFNLNTISKVFLVKTYAVNNIEIEKEMLEEIVNTEDYAYRVLSVLEQINRVELLEKVNLKQEDVARASMINWLKYPTELGDSLEKIEFVDTLEKDEYTYYIYKFTSSNETLVGLDYMIGICGGFETGKLTSRSTGHTFSKFEKIEEDYKKQAEELIEFIADCWKKRLEEYKEKMEGMKNE